MAQFPSLLPGGIDPHVHLDMPFMGTFSSDNYETGTLAALHGGTTTVIDFILQTQGKSLRHALEQWQGRMKGNLYGDLSWHMAVTGFNDITRAGDTQGSFRISNYQHGFQSS